MFRSHGIVMAGLDPATPIVRHGRAKAIGVAGSRPYEGVLR
jgi:hypothetical protein